MKTINKVVWHFEPFSFIMVMGTGMASDLMFSFAYPARWLRICSYIMFAIACLLFIFLQIFALIHMFYYSNKFSWSAYFNHYYRNLMHNVFWGTYPMGLVTIINFLTNLSQVKSIISGKTAENLMIFIYLLWWYDLVVSLFTAWFISFLIWQDYYYYTENYSDKYPIDIDIDRQNLATKNLKSTLLLNVIPLVVVTASGALFTMTGLFTKTFNRNIQLLTIVICLLVWLHAILFVGILVSIFFWNLYVNKLPKMQQVFTMFLVLGPFGQGAFGILLITNNIKLYVEKYYPLTTNLNESNLLIITIPWCFKIFGIICAFALLSMGYFFTIISFVSLVSYINTKEQNNKGKHITILHFHKGFWGMTFPMGTMALGSNEVYVQYNQYVPLGAFRVIAVIYSIISIVWVLICLAGSFYTKVLPYLKNKWINGYHKNDENNNILPTTNLNVNTSPQYTVSTNDTTIDNISRKEGEQPGNLSNRETNSVIELATMANN